jgi:hypothetical protein
MKDKLITLLNKDKAHSVQAMELNKTLGLLQNKEIASILMANLKQSGWVVSEMLQRLEDLDDDWHTFLRKRRGASWTFDYESKDTILSDFPSVTLYGEVGMGLEGSSLEEHGKNVGEFLILVEKQILSWLSKRPLVKSADRTILLEPVCDSEGYGWTFYIAIEIDFDSLTQLILGN